MISVSEAANASALASAGSGADMGSVSANIAALKAEASISKSVTFIVWCLMSWAAIAVVGDVVGLGHCYRALFALVERMARLHSANTRRSDQLSPDKFDL